MRQPLVYLWTATIDLFTPSLLLQWLPDEILFSLASRHHLMSGNALASSTCQQLFGDSRQGSQHDLPCRIDHFSTVTRGLLGSAESIILSHTILPFYLPFRTSVDAQDAAMAMRGSGIGSLKFRLGMLTGRFGANHPLKACLACLSADKTNYGRGYWRRMHQPVAVPGSRYSGPKSGRPREGANTVNDPEVDLLAERAARCGEWIAADCLGLIH